MTISITLLVPSLAPAQVLGPLLPRGTVEVGAQVRWVHRDLENIRSTMVVDQYDFSLPVRYGVSKYATLSAELFSADEGFHSLERDLRYYLIGIGLHALLWKNDDYILSAGAHYTESFIRDKTGSFFDLTHFSSTTILQLQRSFRRRKLDITVWGGPLLFYYNVRREAGNNYSEVSWGTTDIFGGALGLNLLFHDHYQFCYNIIYVDYYQPRIGFSYRF